MKTTILVYLALAFAATAVRGQVVESRPTMRDAVSHRQLAKVHQQVSNQSPTAVLKAAKGADPSKVNQPANILSRSEIISYGGWVTLVPKRAILNLPANYKARLRTDPSAKALGWADFFALNRGWITTVEVTREQAEGDSAFGEELAERVAKSRNLVVATYQGGPIGVMPVKVPDVATTN